MIIRPPVPDLLPPIREPQPTAVAEVGLTRRQFRSSAFAVPYPLTAPEKRACKLPMEIHK